MKHSRRDYQEGATANIPDDEPVFVLRAQDTLAARTVKYYAMLARDAGCTPAHVQGAMRHAEAMALWTVKKLPDVPGDDDTSRETLADGRRRFHGMLSGVVLDFASYLTGDGRDTFVERLADGSAEPMNLEPNISHALVEGLKDWAADRGINDATASMDWKKLLPIHA